MYVSSARILFPGADRNLMPTIKDQAPPDLRNFGWPPRVRGHVQPDREQPVISSLID
jgi:hypothetical protein